MNLLPYPIRLPAQEVLEWLTAVFTSHNGTETRTARRDQPRQYLRQQIPVPQGSFAHACNTIHDNLNAPWAIPLWTEAQEVAGAGVSFTAQPRVWGDKVLFYARSNGHAHYLRNVAEFVVDTLTITEAVPDGEYWLMPTRTGAIEGTSVRRMVNGYSVVFDIRWRVTNNVLPGATSPPLFRGVEVVLEPHLLPVTADQYMEAHRLDSETGVLETFAPWLTERQTRNLLIRAEPEQVQDLRAFLYRRAGRWNPFWMPTFERDYNPVSLEGSLLVVQKENHQPDSIQNIAILGSDGLWYAKEVIGAEIIGDTIEVTLESGIDAALRSVSNLLLWRFDTDRVELRYMGGGVVQLNVRIVTTTL